jgi:erythromycin esterase
MFRIIKKIEVILKKRSLLLFFGLIFIFLLTLVSFFLLKLNINQADTKYYSLESKDGLAPLVLAAAKANFVLLGESSHGTSEYYLWRAEISQHLIKDHDFGFVILEGDWSDIYKLNLYIQHLDSSHQSAREIMENFNRWPTWMWANEEFLSFVEWLRSYNEKISPGERIALYGKDIYGVYDSMLSVLEYLEAVDLSLASLARDNYSCLLKYENDFSVYVSDLALGKNNCSLEVRAVFDILESQSMNLEKVDEKEYFNAQQNALVVIHAENHYRQNLLPGAHSWNARVAGMKNIFNNIVVRQKNKGIVWAHNTHIGDARATEMKNSGMFNIGQLLREKVGNEQVFSIGFGTYRGTVMAGSNWGGTPQVLIMPPAQVGSWEDFLANYKGKNFYIIFDQENDVFNQVWGHRAKGVVYRPSADHLQYVETIPAQRYDAFVFIYQSKALSPL